MRVVLMDEEEAVEAVVAAVPEQSEGGVPGEAGDWWSSAGVMEEPLRAERGLVERGGCAECEEGGAWRPASAYCTRRSCTLPGECSIQPLIWGVYGMFRLGMFITAGSAGWGRSSASGCTGMPHRGHPYREACSKATMCCTYCCGFAKFGVGMLPLQVEHQLAGRA